jgi:hypothetical protein
MTDRGSLGVHLPKAAMTDHNSSPPRKSLRVPVSLLRPGPAPHLNHGHACRDDTAKLYNAVEEALIEGEDFDSDLFEKALLHAYIVDDSILYLDNRKTLMAYAEIVSRNYLIEDPVTKNFHETPNSIKIASTGEDKHIWIPSMERELGAMKRKEICDEVSELPIGTIPLPCMFIYKIKSGMLGFISEYKSRLVCCGNLAKEGGHYQSDELSSSVFTYDSLRTLVSIATGNNWALQQLDISNPYLAIWYP